MMIELDEIKEVKFVEAPPVSLEVIQIDLINDVPAPISKARQNSLIELGQVDPVRLRPTAEGRFDIVDGRRRVVNLLAAGVEVVTALVESLSDSQSAFHSLALNISRSPSPMTEARLIAELLKKYTQQEISKMLGVTQALISQRVGLLDLVAELQDRLEVGEMTLTAARAAKKLPPEAQRELAELETVTATAAKEKLRSYQAEMVDLSAIEIPPLTNIPPTPPMISLSAAEIVELTSGQPITVELNGQPVIITAL